MAGFNLKREKKKYDKKDYVPLSERDDWDGKVEVLRPYKDHRWTGTHFDSTAGAKRARGRSGKMS